MQHAERVKFAQSASERARSVLGSTVGGSFYMEALQEKIVAALRGIDVALAEAGERPLLVPAILPGFDLLAVKRPGAAVAINEEPLDPRAALKLDANTVELLQAVADDAMPGTSERQFTYLSTDGVYYFAFRSEFQAIALEAIGVLPGELLMAGPTAGEVLQ
jgi:hypothetical protein